MCEGCNGETVSGKAFCSACWIRVPQAEQKAVFRAESAHRRDNSEQSHTRLWMARKAAAGAMVKS